MAEMLGSRRRKLHAGFRLEIAAFLAGLAGEGKPITYGGLAQKFGGIARGYGDTLGGVALRCHDMGLPMLSVLVVNADTGLPSVDAALYEELGLCTEEFIKAEQSACFAYDWSSTPLIPASQSGGVR